MMQIQIYETGICEDCRFAVSPWNISGIIGGVYTLSFEGGGSKKINANVFDVWYCNFDGFPMVP